MTQATPEPRATARRTILRLGALGGAGLAFGAVQGVVRPRLGGVGLLSPDGAFAATSDALANQLYFELFPTSPLILSPFTDPLPVPKALAPVPKSEYTSWKNPPGPGRGEQSSLGNQQHQIWPSQVGLPRPDRVQDRPADPHARVHHLEGAADRQERQADRLVRGNQRGHRDHPPGGRAADAAAEHDLRLQRHVPGPDDQRGVRQAGPGAVREPSRREPARPGPAGLRLRRTCRS